MPGNAEKSNGIAEAPFTKFRPRCLPSGRQFLAGGLRQKRGPPGVPGPSLFCHKPKFRERGFRSPLRRRPAAGRRPRLAFLSGSRFSLCPRSALVSARRSGGSRPRLPLPASCRCGSFRPPRGRRSVSPLFYSPSRPGGLGRRPSSFGPRFRSSLRCGAGRGPNAERVAVPTHPVLQGSVRLLWLSVPFRSLFGQLRRRGCSLVSFCPSRRRPLIRPEATRRSDRFLLTSTGC